MRPSVIDTVAKFFYFSSLDEKLTFACSFRALQELRSRGWLDEKVERHQWVTVLSRWRSKMWNISTREWPTGSSEIGFEIPENLKTEAWAGFLANGESSEVEAVLFSRILNFTDHEIATGLGVTLGTVRYRVGRGLRHLGGYVES